MHPEVLLIGGSSSVGKTTVAKVIAARLGWEVVHTDTLLAQHPELDPLRGGPEIWDEPASQLCDLLAEAALRTTTHLIPLIEAHLSAGPSLIIEGERVHPQLCARFAPSHRVRALFIVEPDATRLHETLMARSASFRRIDERRRRAVAEVNRLYGAWLRQQAGAACMESQPWDTLVDRIVDAVYEGTAHERSP